MAAGISSARLTCGPEQFGADLSGDEHQRRGVHQGVGESRDGVRGAGARSDQADAHAPADPGISLRGVYGALLVAHEDVAQSVAIVVQRVVDGDDGPAGVAENGVDAFDQERFEQGLRTCHQGLAGCLLRVGSGGIHGWIGIIRGWIGIRLFRLRHRGCARRPCPPS